MTAGSWILQNKRDASPRSEKCKRWARQEMREQEVVVEAENEASRGDA